jgi:hypothetical protein
MTRGVFKDRGQGNATDLAKQAKSIGAFYCLLAVYLNSIWIGTRQANLGSLSADSPPSIGCHR